MLALSLLFLFWTKSYLDRLDERLFFFFRGLV